MAQVLEKTGLGSVWMSEDALLRTTLPPGLAGLIVEAGSLTERLRAASRSSFRVRLLRQEMCDLRAFPGHLTGEQSASGLLREVYLESDGRPAVFAQTLVPRDTLDLHPWLADLGDKPMGEQLFSRQDLQRKPFDFARLAAGDQLARDAFARLTDARQMSGALWARRSLFLLAGHPISVNEVFFPAALPAAAC